MVGANREASLFMYHFWCVLGKLKNGKSHVKRI